jgi:hypothetical protein
MLHWLRTAQGTSALVAAIPALTTTWWQLGLPRISVMYCWTSLWMPTTQPVTTFHQDFATIRLDRSEKAGFFEVFYRAVVGGCSARQADPRHCKRGQLLRRGTSYAIAWDSL